nr:hypothetical protein [Mycoplasmopsis canis]WQQ12477.1 hypothetical protein RRG48_00300 [Mycoplasmopsis canis]
MKKIKKHLLLSSSILTIGSSLVISCTPTDSNMHDNTNKNKNDSELQNKKDKLVNDKVSLFESELIKRRFLNSIRDAKDEKELVKIEAEIDLSLEKEQVEIYNSKIGFDESTELSFVAKIRLAKELETLLKIKKEIQDLVKNNLDKLKSLEKYNNLTQESKTIINELIDSSKYLTDKERIELKIDELYNKQHDLEKDELKQAIIQLLENLKNIAKKEEFKQQLELETNTYSNLVEIKKSIEKAIQEEKKQEVLEIQKRNRKKIVKIDAFIELVSNEEEKERFKTKKSEANDDSKINSLIEELETYLGSEHNQDRIASFKNIVKVEIEKLTTKENKDEVNSKIDKENITFNELKDLLDEVSDKYLTEVETSKSRKYVKDNLNFLKEKNPSKEADISERLIGIQDKDDLKLLEKELIEEVRKFKPNLPSLTGVTFISATPEVALRITESNQATVSSAINTVNSRSRVETNYKIFYDVPSLIRTFTLTPEDLTLRDKFIKLRNDILSTFFGQRPGIATSNKEYFFNDKTQNAQRATKYGISKLLWTVDKVLREGYYFNEVYNYLLGNENDESPFVPSHTYFSLKRKISNNVN